MPGEDVTGGETERINGDELQSRKGKVKKMKKDRTSKDSVQEFSDDGKKGSEIDKDLGSKSAKKERKKAKGDIFPTQSTEASASSLSVESKEAAGNDQESERIEKRKRKKERDENSRSEGTKQSSSTGDDIGEVSAGRELSVSAAIEEKGKRKKKSKDVGSDGTEPSSGAKAVGNEAPEHSDKRKRKEGDENSRRKRAKQSSGDNGEVSAGGESSGSAAVEKKGKRKKKSKEGGSDGTEPLSGAKAIGKKSRAGKEKCSDDSGLSQPSKKSPKSRRVSFSGNVEVFPPNDLSDLEDDGVDQEDNGGDLVRGKRFSLEEDELVKKAVLEYINTNQLGEDGLKMVLNCRKYPQVLNCWKEIGGALPWRPYVAVYYRAHTIFERSEHRKWEPEEYGILRRFHEEHGPDWKTLAKVLGKDRKHVKDAWRRIKLPNLQRGNWAQKEYQILFDLVNLDLRMKSFEEKKTKHGMLRDNISWEAISQKMSTRYVASCCDKWYTQLTSSLVSQGLWVDTDDYRMLDAIRNSDACCVEDVDWDNLLEHRSGEICRKRWDQMTRYIGGHREKSFIEQVEVLSKRYNPEMLEYRS